MLTVRRGIPPYQGKFALPGGFVLPDEDLEAAAYRELAEEAGLKKRAVTLEQLRTFGAPGRDPRGRVVSVAYLAMGAGLPDPRGGSDALSAQFEPVSEYPVSYTHLDVYKRQAHVIEGKGANTEAVILEVEFQGVLAWCERVRTFPLDPLQVD